MGTGRPEGSEDPEQLLFDNVIARALWILAKVNDLIETSDEPEIIRLAMAIGEDAKVIQDYIIAYRQEKREKKKKSIAEREKQSTSSRENR